MSKFQFLLISALISSVVLLFVGSRDGNPFDTVFPIGVVIGLAIVAQKYLSEKVWNRLARWVNETIGRKIFYVRSPRPKVVPERKLLPPSKLNRLK
ncbi:hypothetical protein H6F42_06390 [Pseudanabaena sp. FACHB-1998]|uniref:hypothetical protein n=1 Tax=Pseudanabaena sp. FACHB-1998 TaxID=2692858 RepID=UPI0016800451|nr:hypothetical protein [Pseudanabaena sp. FACHB-1998]MBD2176542.1 hypothetical protein [Pseudanabaena sp. FACHB-1998]